MAHDGLAMSIRPVSISTDGDRIFADFTGRIRRIREREGIVDIIC